MNIIIHQLDRRLSPGYACKTGQMSPLYRLFPLVAFFSHTEQPDYEISTWLTLHPPG
jgi:hypothetical protein